MNFIKFAAIDIGTNAIRLLITDAQEFTTGTRFNKVTLIRVPIRLGTDVFVNKEISAYNQNRLIKAMNGFKNLIEAFEVVSFRACATSAMREARNGSAVVEAIKNETSIDINIISGKEEAQIIISTKIAEVLNSNKSYLYVDVGGGSTEITLFSNKEIISSNSFSIGTIRILQKQVSKEDWNVMRNWISNNSALNQPVAIIGSGGNINKIGKLLDKKENESISSSELKDLYKYLRGFTYNERIDVLKLSPDRADVIIPAAKIFLEILKVAHCRKIHIPKMGLVDGIVHQLYEKYKSNY